MATGFLCHELYMWHNTPNFAGVIPYGNPVQPYEHAENPETKRRFRNLLDVSGLLKQLTLVEAREATDEEILRFHTSDYLEKIRTLNEEYSAETGMLTPMSRGSFEIAKLAAGDNCFYSDRKSEVVRCQLLHHLGQQRLVGQLDFAAGALPLGGN